ncbi:MAG: hypothetical protein J6W02_01200 [Bacteroidaceae bacterium]|nr:hypothetical protein [Bacteroidaceae bacterium]
MSITDMPQERKKLDEHKKSHHNAEAVKQYVTAKPHTSHPRVYPSYAHQPVTHPNKRLLDFIPVQDNGSDYASWNSKTEKEKKKKLDCVTYILCPHVTHLHTLFLVSP